MQPAKGVAKVATPISDALLFNMSRMARLSLRCRGWRVGLVLDRGLGLALFLVLAADLGGDARYFVERARQHLFDDLPRVAECLGGGDQAAERPADGQVHLQR